MLSHYFKIPKRLNRISNIYKFLKDDLCHMPDIAINLGGFPLCQCMSIQKTVHDSKYFNRDKKNLDFRSKEFYGAINGINYRYISLVLQENRFFENTWKAEKGEREDDGLRFNQDEAMFFFFMSSASLFDCFAYAVYAACSHLCPDEITLDNVDKGNIYFNKLHEQKNFNKIPNVLQLSKKIETIAGSIEYQDIKTIRDCLNHRIQLPQAQLLSNTININKRVEREKKNSSGIADIELRKDALNKYKIWIDKSLRELLDEFQSFTTKVFTP